MRFVLLTIATCLAWLGINPISHACNIPVFRYALERWELEPYELTVFHRGPIGPSLQSKLDLLQKRIDTPDAPANLRLKTVNVDDPDLDKSWLKLLPATAMQKLPWMVLMYPASVQRLGDDDTLASTPFDVKTAAKLLDGPVRQKIASLLLQGHTAVWVLLESGKPKLDDAAEKQLQQSLAKLQKTLKLPPRTDDPADQLKVERTPLKIDFSLVRLPRTDRDQTLVRLLLNTESDLHKFQEPMAFAVFGRGIALLPLIGKGMTDANITRTALFLTGPCTCNVRGKSPGIDLLMPVPWKKLLEPSSDSEQTLPPLTGLGGLVVETPQKSTSAPTKQSAADGSPTTLKPETVETSEAKPSRSDSPTTTEPSHDDTSTISSPLIRNVLLAVVGLVLVLGVVSFFLGKRFKGAS